MSSAPLNLQVVDTALDPESHEEKAGKRVIRYRRSNGQDLYKVWILLDGPDVPFVESARYTLHRTFAVPVHEVARTPSNPRCALIIWTWGLFEVEVLLKLKSGQTVPLRHLLTYDRDFDEGQVHFELERSPA